MSNTSTSESEHNMTACANCGKGEETGINLKSCAACMLVKYCSRDCQVAHRPQHKKECKKRAAELREEKLFQQPAPLEDCPICMIRLPSTEKGRMYMSCCGKTICIGCLHAFQSRARKKDYKCPFCGTPLALTTEESIKRMRERLNQNDAKGMYNFGLYHAQGRYGFPQNHSKALELWHRAGELGHADAYHNIGVLYSSGEGVERDEKKAKHYFELAAMSGCVGARHNLGVNEVQTGNIDRSLKHFMIAIKGGSVFSLEIINKMYKVGYVTKDEYTEALRACRAYVDEIKSDQRDEAAALRDDYKYY